MTHAQQLRKEIQLQLYGARPLAVSVATIARTAQRAGLDATETAVRAECEFLAGKNLAERVSDPASGEVKYKLTSAGIEGYEQ